jgi:hypothetical protein
MESGLNALMSYQFILFSLGVFAMVWVIRTIVEFIIPQTDGHKIWEKLILPLLPITIGTIIGFLATKYAYPDGLVSLSDRLFFGSVAGMFSSCVYQVTKGMLKDKIQSLTSSANDTSISPVTNPARPLPPNPSN